ncbi:UNVERIFIED_CONTAM: hypothetical protein Slati_2192100 [Sesamum latifolium]|uniref:DUF4283 domain-containing protein n=1 Tax=Sesamum latifolium TaxID=2727402 RepID=A0AAW2WRM5_9LAMI
MMPEIFIGEVPLRPNPSNSSPENKFADAFNNSTRRTLRYIPPECQTGEIVVRPMIDMVHAGSRKLEAMAVGYFLGRKPPFFTRCRLTSVNLQLVLQWWEPGIALRKHSHKQVPVWIKLRHLPVEFWTEDGLSTVASGIGRLLYPDDNESMHETEFRSSQCPTTKKSTKPPVKVFVQKPDDPVHMPSDPVSPPSQAHAAPLGEIPSTQNVHPWDKGKRSGSDKGSWNWLVDHTGPGNRIWLAWDATDIAVDIMLVHLQCDHCRVHNLQSHSSSLVMVVYGLNVVIPRRELWAQLVDIMETVEEDAWLVLGDFNTVLDLSEVCGNSGDISTAIEDFWACLLDTGLINVPAHGSCFTWHNCSDGPRSLWKKLDRMVANDRWLLSWAKATCLCSTPRTSDHSALVLKGYDHRKAGRLFHFDNYLAKTPGFLDLVRAVWEHSIYGTPMYSVTGKLKALKPTFRSLRKGKGDLSANVSKAKGFLDSIQHNGPKFNGSKGGTSILKFFKKIAARRSAQKIFQITSTGGDMVFEESEVLAEFINFYSNLLGGQRWNNYINLMFLRPWVRYVITQEEGDGMIQPVERNEVKESIFDIAEDKAPGPDSFSSAFYKAAWSVIGDEITEAVQEFFHSDKL